MRSLFSPRSIGPMALAILALTVTAVAQAAPGNTTRCPAVTFSQPFIAYGDWNYYTAPEG
jgi:hypothetical protein